MDSAESKSPSGSAISGKLVIVVIVTVAFCAAAISWYFRYNATHRVAEFWGPDTVRLIRDAPTVEAVNLSTPITIPRGDTAGVGGFIDTSATRDVSTAHGLVHLRNALLEDH